MVSNEQSWISNPKALLTTPTVVFPRDGMTRVESSNAVARLVIITTVLVFAVTFRVSLLVIGVACLAVLAYLQRHGEDSNVVESFGMPTQSCIGESGEMVELQAPTRSNPLMNVMLTDYKDDPSRPPAAPAFNPVVEADVNQKAMDSELYPGAEMSADDRSKLYQDLGDELVFDQSMRNFYAMPSTTIPNAQEAFAKYCYGDMPSCRDGNYKQCWSNVNNIQTRTA